MKNEYESYEVRQARKALENEYEEEIDYEDLGERKIRRKRRKRKKGCLFGVIKLLIGLFIIAFSVICLILSPVQREELDTSNLSVHKNSILYKNIVLYGLDSRQEEIDGGARSDVIMIASINKITGGVKIFSVYRDTFLKTRSGEFTKVNAAYNAGAASAVEILNRNLDLGIKDYITVNFNSLVDIIDALGGVEIDIKDDEVEAINSHIDGTANITKKSADKISSPGIQNLNGVQAVTYARIRSTVGDDFRRTYRQRAVLEGIVNKSKSAGVISLLKASRALTKNVKTSISLPELSLLAMRAPGIRINFLSGYPFRVTTSSSINGYIGSYVVPLNLESNVIKLHEVMFGEKNYNPSNDVKNISNEIEEISGVILDGSVPEIDTSQYIKSR